MSIAIKVVYNNNVIEPQVNKTTQSLSQRYDENIILTTKVYEVYFTSSPLLMILKISQDVICVLFRQLLSPRLL